MAFDPRAPVLVGVGQIQQRSTVPSAPVEKGEALLEPLELMEQAARRAAEDARYPGLLARIDSIRVPRGLWPYANPAHTLRERLGASGAQTALAPVSGNMVQHMLSDGAREIAAGRRDAVLVVGGEAEHSKRRAKRAGRTLAWSEPAAPEPDREFDDGRAWILREEVELGVAHPATIFSLYENARRAARGATFDENRQRIATLWHGFAKVAEGNPVAWTREAPSVATIRDETADNKMVAFPYTKRLCANMVVDQGAAVILCSAELAGRLGIPRERWVFLHTATDCMGTPMLSHREDFLRVPTLELAGLRALELSRAAPSDFDHVDLYSCFPSAVQVAAEGLGFREDRPLTVTGGLAYAGGPFNSYVLHALATMTERLRAEPGSLGLVGSVGGSFSKHAFGIYSTEPPGAGFQYADLDPEARKLPRRELATRHDGEPVVETYALRYRDAKPALAIVSCLLDDGRRTWAKSEAPEVFDAMLAREPCGRRARLAQGVLLGLED
ncbi:MAG: hypothetical protein QNK04_06410 [Myxococcota bacterium]|nr:hypothetical protein [Myxococcota bacterium]